MARPKVVIASRRQTFRHKPTLLSKNQSISLNNVSPSEPSVLPPDLICRSHSGPNYTHISSKIPQTLSEISQTTSNTADIVANLSFFTLRHRTALAFAPFLWDPTGAQPFVDFILESGPRDIYNNSNRYQYPTNINLLSPDLLHHPRHAIYNNTISRTSTEAIVEGVCRILGSFVKFFVEVFKFTPLKALYPYFNEILKKNELFYKIDKWLYLTPDERLYSAYLNYKIKLLYSRLVALSKMFIETHGDHHYSVKDVKYVPHYDAKHENDSLLFLEYDKTRPSHEFTIYSTILQDYNQSLLSQQLMLQQMGVSNPPSTTPLTPIITTIPTSNTQLSHTTTDISDEEAIVAITPSNIFFNPYQYAEMNSTTAQWREDLSILGSLDPFGEEPLPDLDPVYWGLDHSGAIVHKKQLWQEDLAIKRQNKMELQNPQNTTNNIKEIVKYEEGSTLRMLNPAQLILPKVPELLKFATSDILKYQLYRDGYKFKHTNYHLNSTLFPTSNHSGPPEQHYDSKKPLKPFKHVDIAANELFMIERVDNIAEISSLIEHFLSNFEKKKLALQEYHQHPGSSPPSLSPGDDAMYTMLSAWKHKYITSSYQLQYTRKISDQLNANLQQKQKNIKNGQKSLQNDPHYLTADDVDDPLAIHKLYRLKTKHEYPTTIPLVDRLLYYGNDIANEFLIYDYSQGETDARAIRGDELVRENRVSLLDVFKYNQKVKQFREAIRFKYFPHVPASEFHVINTPIEEREALAARNAQRLLFRAIELDPNLLDTLSPSDISHVESIRNNTSYYDARDAKISETFHGYKHRLISPQAQEEFEEIAAKLDLPGGLHPFPAFFHHINPIATLINDLNEGKYPLSLEQLQLEEQKDKEMRSQLIHKRDVYQSQLALSGLSLEINPYDELLSRFENKVLQTTNFKRHLLQTLSVRPKIVEKALNNGDILDNYNKESRMKDVTKLARKKELDFNTVNTADSNFFTDTRTLFNQISQQKERDSGTLHTGENTELIYQKSLQSASLRSPYMGNSDDNQEIAQKSPDLSSLDQKYFHQLNEQQKITNQSQFIPKLFKDTTATVEQIAYQKSPRSLQERVDREEFKEILDDRYKPKNTNNYENFGTSPDDIRRSIQDYQRFNVKLADITSSYLNKPKIVASEEELQDILQQLVIDRGDDIHNDKQFQSIMSEALGQDDDGNNNYITMTNKRQALQSITQQYTIDTAEKNIENDSFIPFKSKYHAQNPFSPNIAYLPKENSNPSLDSRFSPIMPDNYTKKTHRLDFDGFEVATAREQLSPPHPTQNDRYMTHRRQHKFLTSDYLGTNRRLDAFNTQIKGNIKTFEKIEHDETIHDINIFSNPPLDLLSQPFELRMNWLLQPLFDMNPREIIDLYDLLNSHEAFMNIVPVSSPYEHYEYLLYKQRNEHNIIYNLKSEQNVPIVKHIQQVISQIFEHNTQHYLQDMLYSGLHNDLQSNMIHNEDKINISTEKFKQLKINPIKPLLDSLYRSESYDIDDGSDENSNILNEKQVYSLNNYILINQYSESILKQNNAITDNIALLTDLYDEKIQLDALYSYQSEQLRNISEDFNYYSQMRRNRDDDYFNNQYYNDYLINNQNTPEILSEIGQYLQGYKNIAPTGTQYHAFLENNDEITMLLRGKYSPRKYMLKQEDTLNTQQQSTLSVQEQYEHDLLAKKIKSTYDQHDDFIYSNMPIPADQILIHEQHIGKYLQPSSRPTNLDHVGQIGLTESDLNQFMMYTTSDENSQNYIQSGKSIVALQEQRRNKRNGNKINPNNINSTLPAFAPQPQVTLPKLKDTTKTTLLHYIRPPSSPNHQPLSLLNYIVPDKDGEMSDTIELSSILNYTPILSDSLNTDGDLITNNINGHNIRNLHNFFSHTAQYNKSTSPISFFKQYVIKNYCLYDSMITAPSLQFLSTGNVKYLINIPIIHPIYHKLVKPVASIPFILFNYISSNIAKIKVLSAQTTSQPPDIRDNFRELSPIPDTLSSTIPLRDQVVFYKDPLKMIEEPPIDTQLLVNAPPLSEIEPQTTPQSEQILTQLDYFEYYTQHSYKFVFSYMQKLLEYHIINNMIKPYFIQHRPFLNETILNNVPELLLSSRHAYHIPKVIRTMELIEKSKAYWDSLNEKKNKQKFLHPKNKHSQTLLDHSPITDLSKNPFIARNIKFKQYVKSLYHTNITNNHEIHHYPTLLSYLLEQDFNILYNNWNDENNSTDFPTTATPGDADDIYVLLGNLHDIITFGKKALQSNEKNVINDNEQNPLMYSSFNLRTLAYQCFQRGKDPIAAYLTYYKEQLIKDYLMASPEKNVSSQTPQDAKPEGLSAHGIDLLNFIEMLGNDDKPLNPAIIQQVALHYAANTNVLQEQDEIFQIGNVLEPLLTSTSQLDQDNINGDVSMPLLNKLGVSLEETLNALHYELNNKKHFLLQMVMVVIRDEMKRATEPSILQYERTNVKTQPKYMWLTQNDLSATNLLLKQSLQTSFETVSFYTPYFHDRFNEFAPATMITDEEQGILRQLQQLSAHETPSNLPFLGKIRSMLRYWSYFKHIFINNPYQQCCNLIVQSYNQQKGVMRSFFGRFISLFFSIIEEDETLHNVQQKVTRQIAEMRAKREEEENWRKMIPIDQIIENPSLANQFFSTIDVSSI